jgi:hypothetical protein
MGPPEGANKYTKLFAAMRKRWTIWQRRIRSGKTFRQESSLAKVWQTPPYINLQLLQYVIIVRHETQKKTLMFGMCFENLGVSKTI